MRFDEEIQRRFREKGGRYTADFEQLNTRIKADHKLALREICVKEKWNLGNVVDWLIEGLIANYRQMWPVNGVYQMQLTDTELATETEPVKESPKQVVTRKGSPDYLVKARELWMVQAKNKATRGEDVSDELAFIRSCLDEARAAGDTQAESNITGWIQKLEEMMQRHEIECAD